VAAAILTAAVSFIVPPTYTATTAFVPEASPSSRIPAGLAGLAGQFGLTLGSEASQSPRFYAEVVTSREIMDRVLRSRYADPRSPHNPEDSATLLRILGVRGDDLADSLHHGRERLADRVSVRVDNQTNIVTLRVDSRYPALAAEVANRFVLYLNEFNAKTRQSQARERRRFVEEQVAAAERDLRRAEEELKTFYERNRSFQQSPQLVFEEGRLRRQVEIRQEVYLTLKREYETARIEEVNDTPVITVVDPAVPPQEKSKPKRTLLVLLAGVLGGMVAVFGAFGAEYVRRVRKEDEGEYREFAGLVARMRDDLRAIARRVLRRGRGRGAGGV
jgi:uncharacterized protein involved in exopolysaccharide biosynthesis